MPVTVAPIKSMLVLFTLLLGCTAQPNIPDDGFTSGIATYQERSLDKEIFEQLPEIKDIKVMNVYIDKQGVQGDENLNLPPFFKSSGFSVRLGLVELTPNIIEPSKVAKYLTKGKYHYFLRTTDIRTFSFDDVIYDPQTQECVAHFSKYEFEPEFLEVRPTNNLVFSTQRPIPLAKIKKLTSEMKMLTRPPRIPAFPDS
jgi:hypothetical protein